VGPLVADAEMEAVRLECDLKLRIDPTTGIARLLAIDLDLSLADAVREDPKRGADWGATTARTRAEHHQPGQNGRSPCAIHAHQCRAPESTYIGTYALDHKLIASVAVSATCARCSKFSV